MCDNFKFLSSQVGMDAYLFNPCFFALFLFSNIINIVVYIVIHIILSVVQLQECYF